MQHHKLWWTSIYFDTNASKFGIIMLGLVNNRPKVIGLREALTIFIDHRREIVKPEEHYLT